MLNREKLALKHKIIELLEIDEPLVEVVDGIGCAQFMCVSMVDIKAAPIPVTKIPRSPSGKR